MHAHSALSAFPMIRLRSKRGEPSGSPLVWASCWLGGFACGDPVGRRGVDVEGPNNGGSIEEVREHLVDLGVLLPVVAFGIFFGIPEAERQNTIRFSVRRQHSLVHESGLFLQNRQDLVINGSAKLTCLFRFGG